MALSVEFADYCCELLSGLGPCRAKRMFGGWGISTDGLTVAIVADLGQGETLWLKGDATSRAQFEAAGCASRQGIQEAKQKTQPAAGPPQGGLAPSGGSDPRSGRAWGPH